MSNNQTCDVVGIFGAVVSFISFALCFVGVPAWYFLFGGIALMGLSQVSYD